MATPARLEVGEIGVRGVPTQLKPRVELTLKQKCDIINEAKKHGFQRNSIQSTYVLLTKPT